MSSYKLIYFNLRARGEVIRLLFNYAGVKYEDARVSFRDWPKLKPTTPIGILPVLEIKDENTNAVTRLSQSRAIGRYLAYKFNLAGKTELEKAIADEIVDQMNDEIDLFVKIQQISDKQKKAEENAKFLDTTVTANMKYIESILSKSKSGFLVGNDLTWADLTVINKWDLVTILDKYSLVKKHDEKIRSIPQIATWLKQRPVTKF